MVIQIIAGIGLAGYLLALILYSVEAWETSPLQAVLCIVIPFYLFYFAFVKSRRERPYRLVLAGAVVCFFILPTILYLFSQLGSSHG